MQVREMNNIEYQNLVIFPFKIRMKPNFSLSMNHIIRGNTVSSIFANLKAYKYAEYELCYGCFSRNFLYIFEIAFSKNTFRWMPLYFTAVIAFHLESVNEVSCVQKYSLNRKTPWKKHLQVCTDSSIQQAQADQLNESNWHLAFRVYTKCLCVEKHSK